MNLRKFIGKESTGTAVGVLVVGWFAFESYVLAGDEVRSTGFHEIGVPLTFDVPVAGETYGLTIDRGSWAGAGSGRARGRGHSKRLQWQVIDPAGNVVLSDHDAFARSTRIVKFTPQSTGTHALIVEWDDSGFFRRHGVGYISLLVHRNDHSILRRWVPFIW